MNWRCRSATSRRSPLVSSRNRRWPARAWPDSRIVHFSSARRTKAAIPDLRGDINGLNCFMETVPAHCNIRIMAGRGPLLGAPVKLPRARRGNAMLWPEKKAGKTGISESFKRYPPPDGISGGLFGNFQPVKGHFYGDIKKAAKPFGFAAFFIMLFPILPDGKYFLTIHRFPLFCLCNSVTHSLAFALSVKRARPLPPIHFNKAIRFTISFDCF